MVVSFLFLGLLIINFNSSKLSPVNKIDNNSITQINKDKIKNIGEIAREDVENMDLAYLEQEVLADQNQLTNNPQPTETTQIDESFIRKILKKFKFSSKNIKRHIIEQEDIDSNSITSRTIRDGTITAEDMKSGLDLEIDSLTTNDDLTVGGTIYGTVSGGWTPSGNLDMQNYNVLNVSNLNSLTSTELGYLSGATSSIQTQLTGKQNSLTIGSLSGTANQVTVTGGSSSIIGSGITLSLPQGIATSSTPTFGGLTLSGNLNLDSNLIQNIGATGTDFTGTGGLTLADALTVSSGGTSITGNSTVTGDLDVTGDRMQAERIHIQYDLEDGAICDPWTPNSTCGHHTHAYLMVTSEEGATNCDNDDPTCRNTQLVAHYGDTPGNAARATYDRARGTAGAPTFTQDEDLIYENLFGQWAGEEWPGSFAKNAAFHVYAEVETETFSSCTGNNIDIVGHPFTNNDVIQITSSASDLPNPLVATMGYFVVQATADDFELSATLGGASITLNDCGSGTRTVRSNDGGARFEWSINAIDDVTTDKALSIEQGKEIRIYDSDASAYLELKHDGSNATIGVSDGNSIKITEDITAMSGNAIWANDSSNNSVAKLSHDGTFAVVNSGGVNGDAVMINDKLLVTGVSIVRAVNFGADGGGTDAYTISISPINISWDYTTGVMITFTANTPNTDGASLNVNNRGVKDIRKCSAGVCTTALATGDILAGQVVQVVYDGTYFQVISRLAQ